MMKSKNVRDEYSYPGKDWKDAITDNAVIPAKPLPEGAISSWDAVEEASKKPKEYPFDYTPTGTAKWKVKRGLFRRLLKTFLLWGLE